MSQNIHVHAFPLPKLDQGWIHYPILAKKRRNHLTGRGILGKVTLKNKKCLLNVLQFCFCFFVLVFWLRGMWDLNSPSQDGTRTLCTGRPSLNHCTTKGAPGKGFLLLKRHPQARNRYFPALDGRCDVWSGCIHLATIREPV